MKKIFLALMLLVTSNANASVFSPVSDKQVPSGLEYKVTQPPVEDSKLFAGKRVAILASHGVEEAEITFPYDYLVKRGAKVDVIVPDWTADGIVASKFLKPTLFVKGSGTFKTAATAQYDLLVLTGGAWNAQVVKTDDAALSLIRDHYRSGRPIAAVCAGTSVLINAGLANGLTMTGSTPVRTDLVNAGADYRDQALVISRGIATSRDPNDLPEFVKGIKYLLIGQ